MNKDQTPYQSSSHWITGFICIALTFLLAFGLRMLEWPCWQNPEYRLGDEMLLATHDAYHWLAGACGFGLAVDHPMAVMLRGISNLLGLPAAQVAFWFPPVLASLVAAIVFLWCWALGSMQAGIAAGLIASIAPGFLARTLLGYYDTDLVTLFFPLLIALAPACWCMRSMLLPSAIFRRLGAKWNKGAAPIEFDVHPWQGALSPLWIILMSLSGLLSWWTQEWHSVFPYLIRYNSFLVLFMALALAPSGSRGCLLLGALSYAMPCAGPTGLALPALILSSQWRPLSWLRHFLEHKWLIALLCLFAVWLLAQGRILDTLEAQVNAYLKHSGDAHSSGASSLIYPSVAQSIIEVQDLSFAALFPYFHPWLEAAILGMICYFIVVFKRPGALFLLPLAVLGLLSSRLGGRMVMFGGPAVSLGISLAVFWLIASILRKKASPNVCGWIACIVLCGALVAPFMDMIPALSQGPSINRRHAAALAHIRNITPPDAMLWLWWDWGYAAQYFARRQTIADGARHGGPSLYLPAAVFATDNPRFARQIIRYASSRDNEPGNFFKNMGAPQAQELINKLRSAETPLAPGTGRQYIIASFEMLKLGFWISNFGNWNFITDQGEGGAISIVPQAVAYRLDAGEVKLEGSPNAIFPISINIFAETGLTTRNYAREWFTNHPDASQKEQLAWLASRRNINFLFNRVTDEKLAVDQGIYNSLMTQLLICEADDPRISPYFRLVYDNVFARIYEVLPIGGEREEEK